MKEYAISVICTAALIVLGGALSYREDCKMTRTAFSLILTASVILPIAPAVRELLSVSTSPPDVPSVDYSGEYESTAKEALETGIKEALCMRFGIEREDIDLVISGFDFAAMSFSSVDVRLYAGAALSNITEMKSYLRKNFKECDVRIEIGRY